MLRKKLVLSLFSLFLLIFSGCGDSTSAIAYQNLDRWMKDNGKLKVLSSIGMIDDLVKEITGDRVDHIPLILGEIDPHSYELVKGDEEKFSAADVIFYNGLGLEHGASLAYQLKTHPVAFSLGDSVRKSHPDWILEVNGQIDPHIWADISLWIQGACEIVNVLSEVDPNGREIYQENGQRLIEKMQSVHESIIELMHQVPKEKRYLVTSHDAFNYFVRAYFSDAGEMESGAWSDRFSAPEGVAPDGKLSSAHLKQVITFLKEHRIYCVFPESNVSSDSLRKIIQSCQASGHQIKLSEEILYGDAMGPAGSDADTYLKMIQHNAEVIKKELLCHQ